MLDKLAYSIAWLLAQLWLTAWAFRQQGPWWDVFYGILIAADIIQLGLVLYNASDVMTRRRLWRKLKGVPYRCPHGLMDSDECPECRH